MLFFCRQRQRMKIFFFGQKTENEALLKPRKQENEVCFLEKKKTKTKACFLKLKSRKWKVFFVLFFAQTVAVAVWSVHEAYCICYRQVYSYSCNWGCRFRSPRVFWHTCSFGNVGVAVNNTRYYCCDAAAMAQGACLSEQRGRLLVSGLFLCLVLIVSLPVHFCIYTTSCIYATL